MFFFESMINPSTSGRDSINSIPFFGPRTNTPVARASASMQLFAITVTLMHSLAEYPVFGLIMWWTFLVGSKYLS